ncbi:hypothetical protein VTK26DRAFT_4101 [Humicola hyalothermophila]
MCGIDCAFGYHIFFFFFLLLLSVCPSVYLVIPARRCAAPLRDGPSVCLDWRLCVCSWRLRQGPRGFFSEFLFQNNKFISTMQLFLHLPQPPNPCCPFFCQCDLQTLLRCPCHPPVPWRIGVLSSPFRYLRIGWRKVVRQVIRLFSSVERVYKAGRRRSVEPHERGLSLPWFPLATGKHWAGQAGT